MALVTPRDSYFYMKKIAYHLISSCSGSNVIQGRAHGPGLYFDRSWAHSPAHSTPETLNVKPSNRQHMKIMRDFNEIIIICQKPRK